MTLRSDSFFVAFVVAVISAPVGAEPTVDFNRDVRPILAANCFFCHGPDESHREADLRLDQEAPAKESAIVPGNAKESELIARITTGDLELQMPPQESGKSLTDPQIQMLRNWIDQGAKWKSHWAFEKPIRPTLPEIKNKTWPKNAIDYFVLAQLEEKNLAPSASAKPHTLVRRLHLDLTGLLPDYRKVESFLKDPSSENYKKLVDELLSSEHYGERMAMIWLDAARYADTDGFQGDATRSNWPWRDWVIQAYNKNMPFDQFTMEQFAGDLLPNATSDQILATCFHRNHMTNGEGGRDPEESRIDYVIDRVNTMGTTWLGLTLGCCQCHNHKYEPISQKDYYQFNAFFNSIDEDGRAGGGAKPFHAVPSPFVQQGLEDAKSWLANRQKLLQQMESAEAVGFQRWLNEKRRSLGKDHRTWRPAQARVLRTAESTRLTQNGDVFLVLGTNPKTDDYTIHFQPAADFISAIRLTVLPDPKRKKYSWAEDGHVTISNIKVAKRSLSAKQLMEIPIGKTAADYESKQGGRNYGFIRDVLDDDPRTGWTTRGSNLEQNRVVALAFDKPVEIAADEEIVFEIRQRSLHGYVNARQFLLEFTDEIGPATTSLSSSALEKFAENEFQWDALAESDQEALREQFLAGRSQVTAARQEVAQAKQRLDTYTNAEKPIKVMVLKERKEPRTTHVLIRGEWDKKGEAVLPGFPSLLETESSKGKVGRMELARWLVDDNPLTARVTVNRYWQMYFGAGLVRTTDDFGTQGEPPTHPDLLDWLAVEFMESNWNVKHIHKLIVSSATYRQTAKSSADAIASDPENRLLARAARYRLPSWMIRDAILSASGILEKRMGGPPVYPFQPPGAWADSTMGRYHYQTSVGSDAFRRSIYSFWRRSVAPTMMFDASKRRVCAVRVVRTNTPLHALTLMNDHGLMQAAGHLANVVLGQSTEPQACIHDMARRVLCRNLQENEMEVLLQQWHETRHVFAMAPSSAIELLANADLSTNEKSNPAECAAYIMLANTILNLDEAITRE